MKSIILVNTETGDCQYYETDGETLSRVWELLNNKHQHSPLRVPDTKATQKAASNNPKVTGRLITLRYSDKCKLCGGALKEGEQAYYRGRGHIEHEKCPEPTHAPAHDTPKKANDADFMTSLASLMQR